MLKQHWTQQNNLTTMKKETTNTPQSMKYEIFCGAKDTMEDIAKRGARALNRKTMRWQVIDKTALYEVRQTETKEPSTLHSLFSNLDLRQIAKEKNLII
jgi:hypothetical protein